MRQANSTRGIRPVSALCHQPTENTNLKEKGFVQVREVVEQPVDTEMAEVPESAALDTPAAPRTEVPPAEREQQNEQIEIQPDIAAQEQERQRTANAAADTSGAADDAQGEALQNHGQVIIFVTGLVFLITDLYRSVFREFMSCSL